MNNMRTGWDAAQPGLAPATVGGSTFGQLFNTTVDGQVYAQPVVWNNIVLVATENDRVYGLDAVTGAIKWQRSLGTPWPASAVGCGDLTPNIGVTSTPAVDGATGIAYLVAKTYNGTDVHSAQYAAHAIDMSTGNEVSGWPVTIAGPAANVPATSFDPYLGLQRAGLLLLDGVVYAGFASHCGQTPSRGWVVGISTAGARLTTLWTTQATATGSEGSIWQSGGGLISDGVGQILVQTDDGTYPAAPGPGSAPPANLGHPWCAWPCKLMDR